MKNQSNIIELNTNIMNAILVKFIENQELFSAPRGFKAFDVAEHFPNLDFSKETLQWHLAIFFDEFLIDGNKFNVPNASKGTLLNFSNSLNYLNWSGKCFFSDFIKEYSSSKEQK